MGGGTCIQSEKGRVDNPFVIKGKILLRQLLTDGKKLDWDDQIPCEWYTKWVCFFREMFDLAPLSFKRCVKPLNAVNNPILVIFLMHRRKRMVHAAMLGGN